MQGLPTIESPLINGVNDVIDIPFVNTPKCIQASKHPTVPATSIKHSRLHPASQLVLAYACERIKKTQPLPDAINSIFRSESSRVVGGVHDLMINLPLP
jgi:hypothetical protein